MLTLFRSLALSSPLLLLTAGFSQPVWAQTVTPPASPSTTINPGVCGQVYGLAGRSVMIQGELMRLVDYCTNLQNSVVVVVSPVSQEGDAFWQSFLEIASPSALEFAKSVDREDVITYGATICPALANSSLQEVRQLQVAGGLPIGFDVAVTVAAINTYCPSFRSQIGRY